MLQRPLPGAAKRRLADYDACLPTKLRAEADSLIRYLHDLLGVAYGLPLVRQRSNRRDRWSTFALYMLAGWSSTQVSAAMTTGFKLYYSGGPVVDAVMGEHYP
ncbi:hypothetical protein PMM47T1_08371 [Pseudomonas sp. M47T1]|nr:hypothetical protein PMM47T1_08371 [Pseudomonas sp. M47T1]